MHALAWSPPAWLLVLLVLSGPLLAASAGRGLRAGRHEWQSDDPSGYNSFAAARNFKMPPGTATKRALTPEAAEASANPAFNGVYRVALNPKHSKLSLATVESDPVTVNPDRKKVVVRPRARSAQDVVPGRQINLSSGAAQFPAVAMGTTSGAQTFEGATSISASDSLMVNDLSPKTIVAKSMLTATTRALPARASRTGSFGTTTKSVRSLSIAGVGDGNIALAQADQAVAMSMAGRSRADSWQDAGREEWRGAN